MKPESIRRRNTELFQAILARVPRDADQSFTEEDFLRVAAEIIPRDDPDKQHAAKCRKFFHDISHPGGMNVDGRQLRLFGDEYDYEPERPVFGPGGRVVEQQFAPPDYKTAEARRAREKAAEAGVWAERKTSESEAYSAWAVQQLVAGRPALELQFGIFVTESGFLGE
jgi:hypothetical protein